ncbi:hypothetical protein [Nocardioides iriomotensis]|uniref:Uncharacterized protein n=1 Tax=Nocardioides iriomotensis TaxID=715784 RepID=A0A4Q5IV16_9ACTN|nr:hypothetical protein [Nocardioides iriomotensis]RYU08771.1 hypothetical protein ETU37_22750 [Nocardioides iriomotensis]
MTTTPLAAPVGATPAPADPGPPPARAVERERTLTVPSDIPLVPGPTTTSPEIPDLTQKRTVWRAVSQGTFATTWLLATLAALAALLAGWFDMGIPTWLAPWLPLGGAVAVTTLYAFALGVRTGGRPLLTAVLALLLSAGAAVSGVPVLLAGATVVTATMGAVLGVIVTVPAARFAGVVRECLVATFVASVAAFAANAYDAKVSVERTEYLVLTLSLLATVALVYRLGAGFPGLGTRGAVVVVGGLLLLALSLAYTEALTRWGSPELIRSMEQAYRDARMTLGGVPRPLEALLGIPALAWGVSTRARRRQGWWPCAFGATALAGIATSLIDHRRTLLEAGITVGYGVVIGLVLGYLVIRIDAFLSGTRGARARREEEATAHRPEPRRTAALL